MIAKTIEHATKVICGEYYSIGRLEYWKWSIPFHPIGRKHIIGKFYWRL